MANLPKAKLTKLVIDELAGVDQGAQASQGTVILKRAPGELPKADAPAIPEAPKGARDASVEVKKKSALTSSVMGHTHLLYGIDDAQAGSTSSERMYGAGAPTDYYEGYHSHPWVRTEDGSIVIGDIAGHTHEVGATSVAKGISTTANAISTVKTNTQEPTPMADTKDTKFVVLTEAQHAHFSKLSSTDAEAFIAKSAAERAVILSDIEKANEVIYTSKTDGTVFRKNDDSRLIAMAKREDERVVELAKTQAEAKTSRLEKRASAEIPHLKGDMAVKVVLLEKVEAIADEKAREGVTEMLKAGNFAMAELAKMGGSIAAEDAPVAGTAQAAYEKGLSEFAKSKSLSTVHATEEFLASEAGEDLYNAMLDEQDAAG